MRPDRKRKADQSRELSGATARLSKSGRGLAPAVDVPANDAEVGPVGADAGQDDHPPVEDLSVVLDHITGLSGDLLHKEWSLRVGDAAPQVPDDLLRLLLAYYVQEAALGGLERSAVQAFDSAAKPDMVLATLMFVSAAVDLRVAPESFDGAIPIKPEAWVTSQDYPEGIVKRTESGQVGIVFSIDESGRVASCTVSVSSGNSTLDEVPCRLVQRRGRFSFPHGHGRGANPHVGRMNFYFVPVE